MWKIILTAIISFIMGFIIGLFPKDENEFRDILNKDK